jgi:hypothetical protein
MGSAVATMSDGSLLKLHPRVAFQNALVASTGESGYRDPIAGSQTSLLWCCESPLAILAVMNRPIDHQIGVLVEHHTSGRA